MTYAVAGDLFGTNSAAQQAVRDGWGAVGIKVGKSVMAAAAAS
jgi:hypothetical protein